MSANTQDSGSNIAFNMANPGYYDLRTRKVERVAEKRADLQLTRNEDGTIGNWRPKNPPHQWRLKTNPPELQKIFKRRRGKILGAKEWRRRCELHAAKTEQLQREVNELKHSWALEMEKQNGVWEHGVRAGELDAVREEREVSAREQLRIRTVLGNTEMIEYAAYAELQKELRDEEKYNDRMEVVVKIAEAKAEIAEAEAGLAKDEAENLREEARKLGNIATEKASIADLRIRLLEAQVARQARRLSEQVAAQALLELAG